MKRAHVARQRLLRLGVFKDVEVLIDTSDGKGAVFGCTVLLCPNLKALRRLLVLFKAAIFVAFASSDLNIVQCVQFPFHFYYRLSLLRVFVCVTVAV